MAVISFYRASCIIMHLDRHHILGNSSLLECGISVSLLALLFTLFPHSPFQLLHSLFTATSGGYMAGIWSQSRLPLVFQCRPDAESSRSLRWSVQEAKHIELWLQANCYWIAIFCYICYCQITHIILSHFLLF